MAKEPHSIWIEILDEDLNTIVRKQFKLTEYHDIDGLMIRAGKWVEDKVYGIE